MSQTRLNVLFLSMHYRPEPCDTRTSHLARAFAANGHKASALTSFPNYPFGKVYPGYRQKLFQRTQEDGVTLIRVPMFADHSKSKKRRALSYLSFLFSTVAIGSWLFRRPDLIWIHHPPLTTGFAGYLLSRIKRVPFILEVHDLWPESLLSTGMIQEGRITRAIRRVRDFVRRKAALIVVTSHGMKRLVASQGVTEEKIHVFPQWADERTFQTVPRNEALGQELGLANKFNVFFTGNIGVAQGLDTALDAAKRLRDRPEIQIVLVGAGVELDRLRERAMREGIENVRFLGQFPPERMPGLFAWSDALLLHLLHDPLFAIMVPSKLQTYLAMGKPVLCGVAGDAAQIVEEAKAGFTFPQEDPFGMADAILACAGLHELEREKLGENAANAYRRRFSQAALVPAYEKLFKMVLGLEARETEISAVVATPSEAERLAA
jgi:colanic acid biosynthesis glycosyl transferase WcaI